jgi:hypothetical protein
VKYFTLIFGALFSGALVAGECQSGFLVSAEGSHDYRVSFNGISGSGEVALKSQNDGSFLFTQNLSLMLASLQVESHIALVNDLVKPLSYREEQKGIGKKLTTMTFANGHADIQRKGKSYSYEVPNLFQDQLSQTLHLQIVAACSPELTQIDMSVATPKRLKDVSYLRKEDVSLSEKFNRLTAQQWVFEEGETRDTLLILPALNNLLVLLEHQDGGDVTRLELKSLPAH